MQAQSIPRARPSKGSAPKTAGARGWLARLLVALAVLCVLWVYRSFDPDAESTWFPGCIWRALFGFECAGCGMQRQIHAALNGHFAAAFRFNMYFPVMGPLWLVWYFVPGLRKSTPLFISLAATVPLYMVARNILSFAFGIHI